MEDIIFCSKIQESIENKLNLKKGILQLKNGNWVGDLYIWNNGAWYYGETCNRYANGTGIF